MTTVQQAERIHRFIEALHAWYGTHRRDLPWRDLWDLSRDDRAYRVWISEVMLQQTQVARVIGAFKKFIQEFPSVQALAAASNRAVLVAWRGMGYNSRALRLRDGARVIVRPFSTLRAGSAHHDTSVSLSSSKADSVFPHAFTDLISIPGIGAYTAGAIRTFAFDLPTPVIDTNIRRILHRTFIGPEHADGTWQANDRRLATLMESVMSEWIAAGHRGSDLLSALMDYGSLVQTKTNPQWGICVLTEQGIMRAMPKNWSPPVRGAAKEREQKEPGRSVGSVYIPNRIFRGRIVEVLRDHPNGLNMSDIGKWISPDYSENLESWLFELITKLVQENMVAKKGGKYVLAE